MDIRRLRQVINALDDIIDEDVRVVYREGNDDYDFKDIIIEIKCTPNGKPITQLVFIADDC